MGEREPIWHPAMRTPESGRKVVVIGANPPEVAVAHYHRAIAAMWWEEHVPTYLEGPNGLGSVTFVCKSALWFSPVQWAYVEDVYRNA